MASPVFVYEDTEEGGYRLQSQFFNLFDENQALRARLAAIHDMVSTITGISPYLRHDLLEMSDETAVTRSMTHLDELSPV